MVLLALGAFVLRLSQDTMAAAEANMESGNGEKSTYYLGMPIEDEVYMSARDVAAYNG